MALDPTLVGRTFPPTAPYDASAERIAAFAEATGTPYDGTGPAPATFPIVVAFGAMQELMTDASVGIELRHVVHGQQAFVHERPVRAGDVLTAQLTVTGVRTLGGADVISTSSSIVDAGGALVSTAEATLVHTAGGPE